LDRPNATRTELARPQGGLRIRGERAPDFLSENLQIETNLIDASHAADIERVLFLGSSCIYPKSCPQPIKEEYLLTGPLEPTNEAYALAKISGLKLIEAYRQQYHRSWISLMPTNLYGPGDNYDLENSHVLPALIRRFHEAKVGNLPEVTLWGTGTPRREFLHSDDLARACLHMLENYDGDTALNIGTGVDVTIAELASMIAQAVGYEGALVWDTSKPDGTPRKLLNIAKANSVGWFAQIELLTGLERTYQAFLSNREK
jgi:GDP-L-fucose synthase